MLRRLFVTSTASTLAGVAPLVRARDASPVRLLVPQIVEGSVAALEPFLHQHMRDGVRIETMPMFRLADRLKQDDARGDVVVLSKSIFQQQFANKDLVRSPIDLVRSETGIAVANNAPPPKMQTAEDFAAFLRATPSIAYFGPGGLSGRIVAEFVEKNGLNAIVAPKATIINDGSVATLLTQGKVASAVQQISELKVGGARNIVPLPAALQVPSVTIIGALSGTPRPEQAAELIRLLVTREAAKAYTDFGLTPLFGN